MPLLPLVFFARPREARACRRPRRFALVRINQTVTASTVQTPRINHPFVTTSSTIDSTYRKVLRLTPPFVTRFTVATSMPLCLTSRIPAISPSRTGASALGARIRQTGFFFICFYTFRIPRPYPGIFPPVRGKTLPETFSTSSLIPE